mgnify:CR=1 FL=1
MKKKNSVLFLIIMMIVLIVGIYVAYDRLYSPSARKAATYLAVHQELDKNDIDALYISTQNHNVVIRPSSDDNIKIVYYQRSDNANETSVASKRFYLTLAERAENLDNLFFHSDKPIDTVTIYLPAEGACSVFVSAIDGTLTVEGVGFAELSFSNAYGALSLAECQGSQLTVDINTGDITVDKCDFIKTDIRTISGTVTVNYLDSVHERDIDISSTYGSLYINGQAVTARDENQQAVTIRQYVYDNPSTSSYLLVRATRSTVSLNGAEDSEEKPAEEPAEEENVSENS